MNIFAPHFTDEDKGSREAEALRWPKDRSARTAVRSMPSALKARSTAPIGSVQRLPTAVHRDGREPCSSVQRCRSTKWLLVNHLLCSSKKGMSAHQIHRMIACTYKTAWFMCHRIREAMKQDSGDLWRARTRSLKPTKRSWARQQPRLPRNPARRKIVFSLVERDTWTATRVQLPHRHVTPSHASPASHGNVHA
jgi:hypothetical protein